MIKRLFKIRPLFILILTLVTSPAMAETNQPGQESPFSIGAQEIIEAPDTLTKTAVSFIAQAPELALETADLVTLLDAMQQLIREDLKQNVETLFDIPLQPRTWLMSHRTTKP